MADNTTLNSGSGGDVVRDVAKTANGGAKTQVVIVDIGGGSDGSSEVAWTDASRVGGGNIAPAQTSVGSTATSVASARTGVPGTGRITVKVVNPGPEVCYIGGSGVTTSTGYPLAAGASDEFPTTAAIYGILPSGASSQTISVMEIY